MSGPKSHLYRLLALVLVLGAALLLTTPAFAQDELPPAEPPAVEEPPAEAPAQLPAEPAAEAPALAETVETLDEAGLTLSDDSGDPLPLASLDLAYALGGSDPIIKLGGVDYSWTTADCDPFLVGAQPCPNPIQTAVNYLATNNLKPDDNRIRLEATTFNMSVTINGGLWTTKPSTLILIGAGTDPNFGVTTITGNIQVQDMINFTLEGMVVNGLVAITNSSGKVIVRDVKVTNGFGNGLLVNSPINGDVELDKVDASGSSGTGAYILMTQPKNLVIKNSAFDNNGTDGLNVSTFGAITLNGVSAKGNAFKGADLTTNGSNKPVSITTSSFDGNGGIQGLLVTTAGPITLRRVSAINNFNADGIYLVNAIGASKAGVSIYQSNSSFSGAAGWQVISYGPILMDGVSALNNSSGGMLLNNSSGNKTSVTVKNTLGANLFIDNMGRGLSINTTGAVSITGITANQNAFQGLYVDNGTAGNVTISGGTFMNNNLSGIRVENTGAITLKNVESSSSDNGFGAELNNTFGAPGKSLTLTNVVFNENNEGGILAVISGAITVTNIQANGSTDNTNGYGAKLDNSGYSGNVTVKSTAGPNELSQNAGNGLWVLSNGAVTISNASFLANNKGGLVVENATGTGNVTLTNLSASDNTLAGMRVNSLGAIKGTRLNAFDNGIEGIRFANDSVPGVIKPISISGSAFNQNNSGAILYSNGAITVLNTSARENDLRGIYIDGFFNAPVVVKATNSGGDFSHNGGGGLFIYEAGKTTLLGLTVEDNASHGIYFDLIAGGPVSLTGTVLTGNGNTGATVKANGAITVDKVTASDNSSDGLNLNNSTVLPGAPVTVNRTTSSMNGSTGVKVNSNGAITVDGVSASLNGFRGVDLTNNNLGASGKVTVTNKKGPALFNDNSGIGVAIEAIDQVFVNGIVSTFNTTGLAVNGIGAGSKVTLTNSTFSDNSTIGVSVNTPGVIFVDKVDSSFNSGNGATFDNTPDTSGKSTVTVQRSTFSMNMSSAGLTVYSDNNVTLNGIIANGNIGTGLEAYTASGTGKITLLSSLGINTFNYNTMNGINMVSGGAVSLSKVMASSNTSVGVDIVTFNNSPVTVTCGVFNGNGAYGINVNVGTGTFTLKGVTAIGNTTQDINFNLGAVVPPYTAGSCGSW